jgi:hypothetical protein
VSISLKLLSKIFTDDFIEVPSELIREDYQRKIYKAYEKYYLVLGKKPSIPFFIEKIIPKISSNEAERKSLKDIVSNLPDVQESGSEIKELLEDNFKKTSLVKLGNDFAKALKENDWDDVWKSISKMESIRDIGTDEQLEPDNESFLEEEDYITRVPTGVPSCSRVLSTIPESSVILYCGEPKSGKTALSLLSICNRFFEGASCCIYSYEMPVVQLKARVISYLSGVPYEEVETNKFTIKESSLKVKGVRYAFVYNLSPNEAMQMVLKGKEKDIEALPKRKNVIIFRGGLSSKDIKKAKESGRRIRPLPNNETIIRDMKMYYNLYGITEYLIDYLQIVPSVSKSTREESLTKLIQEVKEFAIETTATMHIPTQSEEDVRVVRYAKSLRMYCDLQIGIMRTSKLDKLNSLGVFVGANRHGPWNFGYIYENKLACMNIVPIDDEEHSYESMMEK